MPFLKTNLHWNSDGELWGLILEQKIFGLLIFSQLGTQYLKFVFIIPNISLDIGFNL